MKSIADLIEEDILTPLAAEKVYKEGSALADRGQVRIIRGGPFGITADVTDGEICRVKLGVKFRLFKSQELRYSCTCPAGRNKAFCRHAIAAAIQGWRDSPMRKK